MGQERANPIGCTERSRIGYVWLTIVIAFIALTAGVQDVMAQFPSFGEMLDPSIRSQGMGSATTAVFWGGDPNYWANPALLGYHAGIRYEYGKTPIYPELGNDIGLTAHNLTLGKAGIGILLGGFPIGVLGNKYSYGESDARGPSGEDLGTYESFEKIESAGIGINAVLFLESIGVFKGGPGSISRFFDAGVGYKYNDITVELAPDLIIPGAGKGEGSSHDMGATVRATPYNSLDGPGYLEGLDNFLFNGNLGFRVDGTFGYSRMNFTDESITFEAEDRSELIYPAEMTGFSVYAAFGFSAQAQRDMQEKGSGLIAQIFNPIISWGAAWDEEQAKSDYETPSGPQTPMPINRKGWELTIANIFSYRKGHVDDPNGRVDGESSGWSLGFKLGKLGGVRYDRSEVTQMSVFNPDYQLDDRTGNGFTIFVDPFAISRYAKGKQGSQ